MAPRGKKGSDVPRREAASFNQALQATAGKRLGWQVGCQRPAVPELRSFDGHTRKRERLDNSDPDAYRCIIRFDWNDGRSDKTIKKEQQ